ncbi:MAG TPA: limonene-1,2-epoxide hydrolase family protein [Acidimicrobiales bacterium]|nr:limonene-1,2-epoxide hydrolase family protein [Acidimicrobiales bacterium]
MTAAETVDAFLAAICAGDLERALTMVSDDVVYDNVPIGPVTGPEGIRQVLGGFLASATSTDWVVHRQVGDDTTVMNERTDRFELGGEWRELQVMGVFEVHDGAITLWRDYFDMAELQRLMGG